MTFDHDKDSTLDAMGVNINEFNQHNKLLISHVVRKSIESEDFMTMSQIAEVIHNEFTYNEILLMASISAYSKIEEATKLAVKSIEKDLGLNN